MRFCVPLNYIFIPWLSLDVCFQNSPADFVLHSYGPSQADVVTFKALKEAPQVAKYPHAYRWYKHTQSHSNDFSSLPGDPSKSYTTYGPEVSTVTLNPKDAPKSTEATKTEEDEDDLFGSDEEEEDPEAVRQREENLAAYKKKKEGKTKPAAKSIVTMDVKPWGKCAISQ